MKLMIIRHADPDYSVDGLTETGKKEAALLSRRMKDVPAAAYYCSPLGRARMTAQAVLDAVGRTAEIRDWLQEFAIFPQDGVDLPARNVWDHLPTVYTEDPLLSTPRWYDSPVFEGYAAQERYEWVCRGLDELLASHGYRRACPERQIYRAERSNHDTVVLFCHFGLECMLLGHLLGVSPVLLAQGTMAAPSSVTTLVTEERVEGTAVFRCLSFGDVTHLLAAGETPSFAGRFCECFTDDTRH